MQRRVKAYNEKVLLPIAKMLVEGWSGRQLERGRRSCPSLRRRPRGERWKEHLRGRWTVAQTGRGPDGVVMPAPALDQDLGLTQAVEDLAIQQFVP